MSSLLFYFDLPESSVLLTSSYDPVLVVVSLVIAIFASFMGFQVAAQAVSASSSIEKQLLVVAGAIAQGGGIWSMHFVGMLAFELCTTVNYDWTLTLISMIPGVLAAWFSLRFLTTESLSIKPIALGGLLVGSGIGAMHYVGMAAMKTAPLLKYDVVTFGLSIVVAVVLAMLSLWARSGIYKLSRARLSATKINLIAGTVMGLAIAAMHYTGMAAARFVSPPGLELVPQDDGVTAIMAAAISFVATIAITVVLGISLVVKYKQITRAANANEERLTSLMNSALEGIVTFDSEGKVSSANPAIAKILGRSVNSLLGQPVTNIVPYERRHLFTSAFFERAEEPLEQKLMGNNYNTTLLDADNQPVSVNVSITCAFIDQKPFFIAFITDIRERLKMETALKENEQKFRSLIANIPGIAYRCLNRDNWPMVFISNEVENITGYSADDFLLPNPTLSFTELFYPEDVPVIDAAVADQQEYTMEYRIIHRDGDIRWLREQGRFIRSEEGNILWLDGFIMDITDRRSMENDLLEAKNMAEQAAASRGRFLANMSHEIRTPMNAVIGFSDILLDTPLNTTQQKHVSTINRSARSLLHLLNDVLDSAKLDKGKLDIEKIDFVLSDEVDTVVSTFWLDAKRKGLDLRVTLSDDLAEVYNGAPERIRQVLTNLIGNAVKFTDEGFVSLRVTPSDEGEMIIFEIEDSGIGMSNSQIQHVFDPFTQADASMSRKYGGTGLGTTISRQLVELMGGSIEVESELNIGSRFVFRLPLPAVTDAKLSRQRYAVTLPSLNVLVVDDIEQNVELLRLLLTRAGHHVDTASNGELALDKMISRSFDIVLMDLQMPVLDGLSAAKQRRRYEKENKLTSTPIIALTASVLAQDKRSAREAGMEGFANKPIDFSTLCQEIARVLGIDGSALAPRTESASPVLIDWSRGQSLWGNKAKLMREIKRFVLDFTAHQNEIYEHIDAKNYTELGAMVHRFKGLSGNIGLTAFMVLCQSLEQAIQDKEDVKSLVDQLYLMLNDVETTLEYSDEIQQTVSETHDLSQINQVLNSVLFDVKQNRIAESNLAKLNALSQSQYANDIQSIIDTIEDFEFGSAAEQITKLIKIING